MAKEQIKSLTKLEVKMSRKGPFIVLRLVGLLLLISLMLGGGFMTYKAGYAQGVSQAPVVAKAIEKAAESGQGAPVPPMVGYGSPYGYGYPIYGPHHFGFFPFGVICGSIFFLFLFLGFMKMIFFRPWRHGHMHGSWGKNWEGGVPSMFAEWHKHAHEVPAGGGENPTEVG
jgi:hypothetical protein